MSDAAITALLEQAAIFDVIRPTAADDAYKPDATIFNEIFTGPKPKGQRT